VPGIERQPLKKRAVDESPLLRLLHRWREETEKAGCKVEGQALDPTGRLEKRTLL
jgi:hypothetical protein